MRSQLEKRLLERVNQVVAPKKADDMICSKIEQKRKSLSERSAEIVKAKATGQVLSKKTASEDEKSTVFYHVHFQYVIKQADILYVEEEIEQRKAVFYKETLVEDEEVAPVFKEINNLPDVRENLDIQERIPYQYDRLKAVQYAERWWNDYNPAYHKFDVDCTNYISQCLRAGGAPMWGQPNRGKGWWMSRNTWSYSWAVAHSLRWYLAHSKTGLRAKEVQRADQLLLGDVICYDFQGDGRFDHNTIVTGKDANGMPLVNAHTYNSRMRYWAYEDSSAYTPNIQYKFFTIVDG